MKVVKRDTLVSIDGLTEDQVTYLFELVENIAAHSSSPAVISLRDEFRDAFKEFVEKKE